MASINERIRQARKEAGLTQLEAADRLNITPTTLNRYEMAHRAPTVEFLIALIALTGCSLAWLLVGDDSAESKKAVTRKDLEDLRKKVHAIVDKEIDRLANKLDS